MNPYFAHSYSLLPPPGEGKVPVECSHAVPALNHGQVTQAGHGRLGQGHQVRGQDFLLEEDDGKHTGSSTWGMYSHAGLKVGLG